MSDYDSLAFFLDPFYTMGLIADLKEDEGKADEAEMWRMLAKKRRFPSLSHGRKNLKYRWCYGAGRTSSDRLPLSCKAPAQPTVRLAFEKAVEAMMKADRQHLLRDWKRLRGED